MKRDLYQEVTDRIIELIESGQAQGDWMKPWAEAAGEGLPENAVTHKTYRGSNVLWLWASAMQNGYTHNLWATYRQWSSIGCQVRGGERSEWVVFFKRLVFEEDPEHDETRSIPLLRYARVFNADQVDGYEFEDVEQLPEAERMVRADVVIERTGAKIKTGAAASYNPDRDEVTLPQIERFTDEGAYYSVAFHELTHWTGHPSRLDRDLEPRFRDAKYAAEELVAELGAAFSCALLGIEPQAREDHAEYVAHWLQLLRDDKKAIVTAASKAADATDLIHERAMVTL